MPGFDIYEKFLVTYDNPGLSLGQQLVRTAGKGRKKYEPPKPKVIENTWALFEALGQFDKNPTQETFDELNNILKELQLKAVRIKDCSQWLYITPDAPVGTAQWEAISFKTQFNLSWHIGSTSKVAISDEHNGTDGAFRVVDALVKNGDNLKFVMSNSRHKSNSDMTTTYGMQKKEADWSHSFHTIAYPIFQKIGKRGYTVINIHGWATKQRNGLIVNNQNNQFIKTKSYPTLLAIALAKYFNNNEFVFGGDLPGWIVVDGVKKRLNLPDDNRKNKPKTAHSRTKKAPHNTNVIGHCINNGKDSGRSCHIETGGRLRNGGPALPKFAAAVALANYWSDNYVEEIHNPWNLQYTHPEIFNDMSKYGTLFERNPELELFEKSLAAQEACCPEIDEDADFEADDSEHEHNHDDLDSDFEQSNDATDGLTVSEQAVLSPTPNTPVLFTAVARKRQASAELSETTETTLKRSRRNVFN